LNVARPLACLLAIPLFLVATPASACAPLPPFYFETGSSRLDAESRRLAGIWADEFRRAQRGARIRLTAGTDGVGSAGVNGRLARRRGETVRAALIRHGDPSGAIDIQTRLASTRVAGSSLRTVEVELVATPAGCQG
jgi:OmpA family